MQIEPLFHYCLIEPMEDIGAKVGSIHLPTASKLKEGAAYRRPNGKVVAVGPGAPQNGIMVKMTVSVGDRVIFLSTGATEIPSPTEEKPNRILLMVPESHCQARIKD